MMADGKILPTKKPDVDNVVKSIKLINHPMGLNIGAIWNVIFLWIHRGMHESPNEVRNTIEQYLTRLKQTKT